MTIAALVVVIGICIGAAYEYVRDRRR